MMFQRILVGLVEFSRRHALVVVAISLALAAFSGWYASNHLGVSTDTDKMFAESLPWRQRAKEFDRDFPQFADVLAIVIDARQPEAAEATAASLAAALSADHMHFRSVTRPDASPFFAREGLLFLDQKQLEHLLNGTIDAQPFLGQLVADPTARGLFASLALLGMGAQHGEANFGPYTAALDGFHRVMAGTLAGHPQPLSWSKLLGGGAQELAGKYKFVLVQPKLDFGALAPGKAATDAIRQAASGLPFVKSGDARVRITGNVALADEEFSTVAEGAVEGMVVSLVLITLWLFLAVHSWRLIVPILMTLGLGLMLTLLFASVAVGTLNLVSVGFGILFVGIAVDFAIQFSVRYRGMRLRYADADIAMRETGRRVGRSNPRRGGGDRGRISRLRPDRLPGSRRTRADRGRRHADRLSLHAPVPAGRDHPVPAAREGRLDQHRLGRAARPPDPAAPAAHPRPVRGARTSRLRPAAQTRLRFRSLAHEEPEHGGDADALRPDGQPRDQPVHDRHPDAERRRRREPRRPAASAAAGRRRHDRQQLRSRRSGARSSR